MKTISSNADRMQRLNLYTDRVKELFERKYTKEDWEIGLPATKSYFKKCQKIASREIFGQ